MNLNTLYYSPTKTTKKIVDTIADEIGEVSYSYDITLVPNRQKSLTFSEDDLLILGLPVYAGRIPIVVAHFIKQLFGNNTPVVLIAVYGNRHYDDALVEMNDILCIQGFKPIAAGAFIGEHSYTPKIATDRPDGQDLDKCRSFAKDISALEDYKNLYLEVKGNRPYKKRPSFEPIGPTVHNNCISCGQCVSNCPVNALTLNDKIVVDEDKCIRCHSCVRVCPTKAIRFDNRINPIKQWLEENFSTRREPEVFIAK